MSKWKLCDEKLPRKFEGGMSKRVLTWSYGDYMEVGRYDYRDSSWDTEHKPDMWTYIPRRLIQKGK